MGSAPPHPGERSPVCSCCGQQQHHSTTAAGRGRGLVSPEPWGCSHQLLTFGIYLDTMDNKIWAGPGLLCSSCSSSFEKLGSNNLKCNNLYHYWWLRKKLLDKLPDLKPSEALAIMNPEYKPFFGLFYSKLVDRRKIVNEWLLQLLVTSINIHFREMRLVSLFWIRLQVTENIVVYVGSWILFNSQWNNPLIFYLTFR